MLIELVGVENLLLSNVITKLVHKENEGILETYELKYRIYWSSKKHCEKSKQVFQVDGKFAWVCTHEVKE